MHKAFALSLALIALPGMAAEDDEGQEYKSWCSRSADREKVAADKREEFIEDCIESLVDADKNPKQKKKKGDDE